MLNKREQQIWDLVQSGKSYEEIHEELSLSTASVRTYYYRAKKILKDEGKLKEESPLKKAKASLEKICREEEKVEDSGPIYKCRSFAEFKQMMEKVRPKSPKSDLAARIAEFKDAYCMACIYEKYRCNECPTKVLIEKYL